jgi:hypothetical protein
LRLLFCCQPGTSGRAHHTPASGVKQAFCDIGQGCAPGFLEVFFYTRSKALHHAELTDFNVKIFLQGGKNSFQTAALR